MNLIDALAFWRTRSRPAAKTVEQPETADTVSGLLSVVERLAAACTGEIHVRQVQAICGFELRDESNGGGRVRHYRGRDPRAASLIGSISLVLSIPDARGVRNDRSEIEIGVKPGVDTQALYERWGGPTRVYIVSPTHQSRNLSTAYCLVNGIEVVVGNAGSDVESLTLILSRGD